jgi:tetratricopeptide (TPR) repeat protein
VSAWLTPPSRWDAARDPGARERWNVHVKARELMAMDRSILRASLRNAALDRARALLEQAGAANSPDPRLRFDLGEVYEHLNMHDKAIAVLRPAVDQWPDHSATVDAVLNLAYAYAKVQRSKDERDMYIRYLAKVTDDRSRSTAVLNLAEAEMHLGNLDEAVAGYRDAIQITTNLPNSQSAFETGTLAVWGLAVALDRNGDPSGALEQAKLAIRLDVGEHLIEHGERVFFEPKHEREWYLALGAIAHAKTSSEAREILRYWAKAEQHWTRYVTQAKPTDRWLPLARAQLTRAQNARQAAEKSAAKVPPPPKVSEPYEP